MKDRAVLFVPRGYWASPPKVRVYTNELAVISRLCIPFYAGKIL